MEGGREEGEGGRKWRVWDDVGTFFLGGEGARKDREEGRDEGDGGWREIGREGGEGEGE